MNRRLLVAGGLAALIAGLMVPLVIAPFLAGVQPEERVAEERGEEPVVVEIVSGRGEGPGEGLPRPGEPVEPYEDGMLRVFENYSELVDYLSSRQPQDPLSPVGATPVAIIEPLPAPAATPTPRNGESVGYVGSPELVATNVQVSGVDESDIADTNGRVVAVARGREVLVYDLEAERLASKIVVGEGASVKGLIVAGERLILVSYTDRRELAPINPVAEPGVEGLAVYVAKNPSTRLTVLNVSDPYGPQAVLELDVSGEPLGARLEGSTLILTTVLPVLQPNMVPLVGGEPARPDRILALGGEARVYVNLLALDMDRGEAGYYSFLAGSADRMYYRDGNLLVVTHRISYEPVIESILRALAKILEEEGFGGDASGILLELESGSLDEAVEEANKVLAALSNEDPVLASRILAELPERVGVLEGIGRTAIHVFKVEGAGIGYTGSVEVPGRVLDQFSVEIMGGSHIVVATTLWRYALLPAAPITAVVEEGEEATTTFEVVVNVGGESRTYTITIPEKPGWQPAPGFGELVGDIRELASRVIARGPLYSSVYTIDLDGLRVEGSLEGIGEGQMIFAARLIGSTLYLVTYFRIDPLYAVDLSVPEEPRLLGRLEGPGFSEYLHPVGPGLLLGVGMDDRGPSRLKVSLYRVEDPLSILEADRLLVGPRVWSPVLRDYHSFNFDPGYRRAFVPLTLSPLSVSAEALLVVRVGGYSLVDEALIDFPGLLRVFVVGDMVVLVGGDSLMILDRDTLEREAVVGVEG